MTYNELNFTILSNEEFYKDLLIDALSRIGFDTFEDTETGFKAFIPSPNLDENKLDILLKSFKDMVSLSYQISVIPHQNWNQIWESNFEPLLINKNCYVRATFHEPHPEYQYEIIIDPKMAFGTGHHQTTALMLKLMMEVDFKDKRILDMGCGTGILAILASKLGAADILAVDYDQICYESTIENAGLNNVGNVKALCGSLEVIPDQKFDIILANINRNILIVQMDIYYEVLKPKGIIFLSGFYEDPDLSIIKRKAELTGFVYSKHEKQDEWVVAKFIRN